MINVTRSSMPDFEEYCNEIKELWDTRWLTNAGAKHRQLEEDLKTYLGAQNIELYVNGHLALENIITGMGLKGEIITSPFTFASTTHAIVRCGCTPVFCDINRDDYTIDVNKIEGLITEKTVAILPIHVYGNICDVNAIQKIADKYNLKVIYDSAHAFGVTYNGESAANFGDASMFSFHATKVFNTIEGGAVVFKDSSLKTKLDKLRNFGLSGDDSQYVGGNAKMNEFAAAMGICNLRHIDSEIEKRKAIYNKYHSRLDNVKGITLCRAQNNVISNYAYFPVLFSDNFDRDKVMDKLKENDIMSRKYFYPITNSFKCYENFENFNPENTPIAHEISEHILCLPIYADLSLSDADRICDIILE